MIKIVIVDIKRTNELYGKVFDVIGTYGVSEREYKDNGYYTIEVKHISDRVYDLLKDLKGVQVGRMYEQ